MKNLKVAVLAILGLVALSASVKADPAFTPTTTASPRPAKPKDTNGLPHENLSFIGAKIGRNEFNTAPAQISQKSGLLYGVCAFGTIATISDAAMAYDTSDYRNISNGSLGKLGWEISPAVFGTAYVGATNATVTTANNNCWMPPVPVRFESGLVLVNNAVTIRSIVIYRPDEGTNP